MDAKILAKRNPLAIEVLKCLSGKSYFDVRRFIRVLSLLADESFLLDSRAIPVPFEEMTQSNKYPHRLRSEQKTGSNPSRTRTSRKGSSS